ncbi:hypothetical protein DCS_05276 [Drechmeria coniospora]|uniref:Pierisin-like domain-containing protein n=1 Tax=Drechmeria coniospora TaxID=98403 RepID=A0A151GMC1_DRECN|nr:hypothetical protein DCS_05276 [Drechmeria coniospora]KYK58263.1 hypothetical protein DCS_05276 [Drechmeria coniospora]
MLVHLKSPILIAFFYQQWLQAGRAMPLPPGAIPAQPGHFALPETKEMREWKISEHMHGSPNPPPKLVYRFDRRQPDEIFKNGFSLWEDRKLSSEGYDISRHVYGGDNLDKTNYISTTRLPEIAEKFGLLEGNKERIGGPYRFFGRVDMARMREFAAFKGTNRPQDYPISMYPPTPKANRKGEKHWIYVIKPDKSFVNVFQSLGPDGYPRLGYRAQQEFAALERIPAERIVGAYQIGDAKRRIKRNPNYNSAFDRQEAGIGYPALAHNSDEKIGLRIIAEAKEETDRLRAEGAKMRV